MKAEYLEKYDMLKDMTPGSVAVSADREKLFICVYVPNKERNDSHIAVVDLNNSCDQYVHKENMNQQIRILSHGDKFVFTV